MSRKSDIEKAEQLLWDDNFQTYRALKVAYDLGRAAQAAQLSRNQWDAATLSNWAKRLRAKVRKVLEGK